MNKRICIDCRSITGRPSGIAMMVGALVDHMPVALPNCEFLFIRSSRFEGKLSTSANVKEVALKQAGNSPSTLFWLPRLVDLKGVDLFHAPYNILPCGLNIPTVTTVHDIMWLTNPELCRVGGRHFFERPFYRFGLAHALKNSSIVATVSEATSREISKSDLTPSNRLRVTLSGVSKSFQRSDMQGDTLRKLQLESPFRFILTVGQNAPYKNHRNAIRAFAEAFGDRPEFKLVLVQRRALASTELRALVDELAIADRVVFLNGLAQEELIDLYSGATALLHPSFCEGFGNPLAEAMACGCPVVTSNISAMPEVTAGAALLAPPDSPSAIARALQTIANDASVAQALRDRGLKRARSLSWENFAMQNAQIYRSLLAI